MSRIALAGLPVGRYLTDRSRVKDELGITDTSWDDVLDRLIAEASEAVYHWLGRPLYRAQYTESLPGNDRNELMLSRYPIASIDAVSHSDVAQDATLYAVSDAASGMIHSDYCFAKGGDPLEWSITYTAGYFVVDDLNAATTISVDSADDSYNDSGNGFSTLIRAGDWFAASGFTAEADNGNKLVVTADAGTLTVTDALTTEAAGSTRTLTFENVPSNFSRAAMELVKTTFLRRKRDNTLTSLEVGPIKYTWNAAGLESVRGLLADAREAGI